MGRLMKALAARATRYRNRVEGRSGTLWEGRYKSSPVQTEMYLLACTRYIALSHGRARRVRAAGDYAWSSYCERTGEEDRWIGLDPSYIGTSWTTSPSGERDTPGARSRGYPSMSISRMREALRRGQLTGDQRFVDEVEQVFG